jgi:hypothetical protein
MENIREMRTNLDTTKAENIANFSSALITAFEILHKVSSLTNNIYLLTYLLTPWYRILFEMLIVTQLIKKYPDFFMEPPEGTSQFSQKPTIGPYPEPAESNSLHRLLSLVTTAWRVLRLRMEGRPPDTKECI